MKYCIDSTSDEPIMLINTHIGYDEEDGQGVDGGLFQQELLQLDCLGKKRIQIWINSVGGNVMEGYNIYSAILKTITPVDTYAMGGVASIAAVIFQAGRKRIMADYAWLMFHNPFGTADDAVLDVMKDSIGKMISERSGMTLEEVDLMMNADSYIKSEDAKSRKLCDSIDRSREGNTKYLRKITDRVVFHKECNNVLNSIIKLPIKHIDMLKVTMKLGLNDSAPEDSIVKAIDKIEERALKAERELATAGQAALDVQNKAKKNLEELQAKYDKLKEEEVKNATELKECKDMIDAIEKDKLEAEKNAEADKAKNMITGFAKIGRIKNEEATITKWSQVAVKLGIDECKNMIEALPLNKEAPAAKIDAVVLNKGEVPTTAAGMAARNRVSRQK